MSTRTKSKGPRSRATKWKRALKWTFIVLVLLANVSVYGLSGAVVFRDTFQAAKTPSAQPPSLEQLNRSIYLAERYVKGLYKPLPNGEAVQSEAYGLPLKAYFLEENKWVFLGEGTAGECVAACKSATTIKSRPGSDSSESYLMSYTSPSGRVLEVQTTVDWAAAPGKFSITLQPKRVTGWVELSIDTTPLARFTQSSTRAVTRTFPNSRLPMLRMLRYTVRHAVQEAYMYWKQRGDTTKTERLATFLRNNGFTPGYDMRAIIFDQSDSLPDNLALRKSAYPDCQLSPTASYNSYPYHSKVCLGMGVYLGAGKRDSFLQASQALETLQKGNPSQEYKMPWRSRWWMQGSNPTDTARHLEKQWSRTGFGIPACMPHSCSDKASGIRTFVFGALETELGYRHGQTVAQRYADAAAAITVQSQIKSDGLIQMGSRTLYRPAQVGAFPAAWGNSKGWFAPPTNGVFISGIAAVIIGATSMPSEYIGVQVSNSETTFDGLIFLVRYRCEKYGVGCTNPMS